MQLALNDWLNVRNIAKNDFTVSINFKKYSTIIATVVKFMLAKNSL